MSDVPPSAQEIESRLESLNHAYSALMGTRNPSDEIRSAFREALLWFENENRRIPLRHLKPDDPWTLM